MGREYAHRRYGANAHSRFPPPTFLNSWYGGAEREMFFDEQNPDASKIHIPSGFLHDIIDDNIYNTTQPQNVREGNAALRDTISGYSISTIYGALDGNTKTATDFINKLGQNLPSGAQNTTVNYNNLKSDYGY